MERNISYVLVFSAYMFIKILLRTWNLGKNIV